MIVLYKAIREVEYFASQSTLRGRVLYVVEYFIPQSTSQSTSYPKVLCIAKDPIGPHHRSPIWPSKRPLVANVYMINQFKINQFA